MEKVIRTFKNEQFGRIRTMVDEKGEPWFVGTDVAKMLGYNQSDKAILRHTDEDDRMKCTVTDNLGRGQNTFIINESGLYSLVLASKLPQAKAFKRWVTSEVLPQIRKTGGYIPLKDGEGRALSDLEIMCRAMQIMKRSIEQKEKLIADLQPKADYCRRGARLGGLPDDDAGSQGSGNDGSRPDLASCCRTASSTSRADSICFTLPMPAKVWLPHAPTPIATSLEQSTHGRIWYGPNAASNSSTSASENNEHEDTETRRGTEVIIIGRASPSKLN